MKEFLVAATEEATRDDGDVLSPVTFLVGGYVDKEGEVIAEDHEVTVLGPNGGQMTYLIGAVGSDTGTISERAAGMMNFLYDLMDEDDARWFRRRLLSRRDPFGPKEVGDITDWLLEQWVGRPTKSPSDYLPSRKSGGPRSTAAVRHRASTRSTSGPTGSST